RLLLESAREESEDRATPETTSFPRLRWQVHAAPSNIAPFRSESQFSLPWGTRRAARGNAPHGIAGKETAGLPSPGDAVGTCSACLSPMIARTTPSNRAKVRSA